MQANECCDYIEVMKQAREALECLRYKSIDPERIITALTAAIEQIEEPEPVKEPDDWDINSMDAAVWAKAFADRFTVWSEAHGVESDTFGLMVGWFANAIMAGYDEAARRNTAHAIPEGWQLVPKEPTVEMREVLQCKAVLPFSRTKGIWEAMLAAAPKPEDVK